VDHGLPSGNMGWDPICNSRLFFPVLACVLDSLAGT
jgi:hypothetical protein